MELVLSLLVIQGIMGAFDNFWHHEITEALPSKPSARGELALHTIREFLYGIIFLALGWSQWHGAFAWLLAAMLLIEGVVTMWDFIVEDMTRKLPPLERVLHTLLAMNYGAVLVILLPVMWGRALQPTAIIGADHGILSWIMTLYAIGILAWSLRDAIAVAKLSRLQEPEWKRKPFTVAEGAKPRTVLVTGATGFIGGVLCRRLIERGDALIVLTRDRKQAEYRFGPHVRIVEDLDDIAAETTIDAVVNLAGAPVLGLPWTRGRRAEIMQSRIGTTEALLGLMGRLNTPPEVLVNASAIGVYGRSGDTECDETQPPQDIFMSDLCRTWEETAWKAHALGVRVCLMRLGLVLGADGGPLPALAGPARFGLGAVIGPGSQWNSWVHVDDVVAFVELALEERAMSGPYNVTAPQTVTQKDFMATLGRVLHRPVLFKVPAWALRFGLGEMSDLLVEGQRTVCTRSEAGGFNFTHPTLEGALADLLIAPQAQITVLYNAACPVCDAEISHYRRAANENAAPLAFSDINVNTGTLADRGISDLDLKRRMHVAAPNGEVASGVDAFLAIWRRLPNYRWLAALVALPGIRQLCSAAYEWVAVPLLAAWNARRERQNPT